MRNINEFNIPAGNSHGYEILYFGVNLILMLSTLLENISYTHTDDESTIGILTERDFLSKVCSKDLQASKVKVADIMSKIQMSAQPNTPIEVAVQRMINNKIRRLPVMESGKVVGIITVTDMAKELRNTLLMDGVLSILSEV